MSIPIYVVNINYEIYKYRTKKGRKYLSKACIKHFAVTSSTIKDIAEMSKDKDMLARLLARAKFNPWSPEQELKITKLDIIKQVGYTNEGNVIKSNGDFEKDLKIGEDNEMVVSSFLEGKGMIYMSNCTDKRYDLLMKGKSGSEVKFEVKTDVLVNKNKDTGNVAIEIRYKKKPSGISSTEAEWFVYYFANLDKENLWMIKVKDLKTLIKKNKFKIVMGGDNNDSELVLIKRYDYIGEFKVYDLCREENTKGKNL